MPQKETVKAERNTPAPSEPEQSYENPRDPLEIVDHRRSRNRQEAVREERCRASGGRTERELPGNRSRSGSSCADSRRTCCRSESAQQSARMNNALNRRVWNTPPGFTDSSRI